MILCLEKCCFLSVSKNRKGSLPWLFTQLTLSRRKAEVKDFPSSRRDDKVFVSSEGQSQSLELILQPLK